jgi:hypothetical protein
VNLESEFGMKVDLDEAIFGKRDDTGRNREFARSPVKVKIASIPIKMERRRVFMERLGFI